MARSGMRIKANSDVESQKPFILPMRFRCAVADPACGNGKVELGETCDDGNSKNGDGCSQLCSSEFTVIDDFNRADSDSGLGTSSLGYPWQEFAGNASSKWKLSGGSARAVWTGGQAPNPVAAAKAVYLATFNVRVKFMLATYSGIGGPVLGVAVNSSNAGKDPAKDTGLQVHLGAGNKGIYIRRNNVQIGYKASTNVDAGKWYYLLLAFDGQTFAATVWEASQPQPVAPAISAVTTNVDSKNDAISLTGDRSGGESVDLRIDEIIALE